MRPVATRIDTSTAEPFGGIVSRNRGTSLTHAAHHCAEVDLDTVYHCAQPTRPPGLASSPSRTDDRLGRDAAGVETVAAEKMAFDEGDACTQAGCTHCAYESGSPTAKHDEIVRGCGLRIPPLRGVHLIDEVRVRIVWGHRR